MGEIEAQPVRVVLLDLGCTLKSSEELLKLPIPTPTPDQYFWTSRGEMQAPAFLEILQMNPVCS